MALADAACRELSLDRVLFIPTHVSPLKKASDLLPLSLRLGLLRAALKGRRRYRLELCEVRRGGTSYTVDTLRYLRRKLGAETVLFFICGADTVKRLSRWKSPRKVLQYCRFVAANRPGEARVRVRPGILALEMPPVDVSASEIRRRLRRGASVRGLVPPACERRLQPIKGDLPSKPRKR